MSVKRTDFDGFGLFAPERLRKEDEVGARGRVSLALAKSAER